MLNRSCSMSDLLIFCPAAALAQSSTPSASVAAHPHPGRRMASIYAEIHQNIQDKFNEARVEICSPHSAAVRDANRIAIPADHVPDGYAPPAFRISVGDGARRAEVDVSRDPSNKA